MESKRLNIGCGDDTREEYVNFDKRDLPGVDVTGDARKLPFDDESFDLVIAQDVLEHFWDYEKVLEEWLRVVSTEGALAVRVPDWEALKDDRVGGNFNFDNLEGAIYGGHKNDYDQHHRLYTREILGERLKDAGAKQTLCMRSETPPVHWHLIGIAVRMPKGLKYRDEAVDELTKTTGVN